MVYQMALQSGNLSLGGRVASGAGDAKKLAAMRAKAAALEDELDDLRACSAKQAEDSAQEVQAYRHRIEVLTQTVCFLS